MKLHRHHKGFYLFLLHKILCNAVYKRVVGSQVVSSYVVNSQENTLLFSIHDPNAIFTNKIL